MPGWYADPEIRVFAGQYWIYPTYSDHVGKAVAASRFSPAQKLARQRKTVRPSYGMQTFFDAFSSPDLVHWTRHRRVFDVQNAGWAAYAIWAPSVIEANGRYYMFFSANDIQSDAEPGGIGLAVSATPGGRSRTRSASRWSARSITVRSRSTRSRSGIATGRSISSMAAGSTATSSG
ncbi:family 43 glycosylhydrolase [Sphingomonas sp. 22R3R2A-7]